MLGGKTGTHSIDIYLEFTVVITRVDNPVECDIIRKKVDTTIIRDLMHDIIEVDYKKKRSKH